MVGAVVVRRGRVVGRGYHTRAGAPHAEVVALRQAGARARGATLYVNLEPCCHYGRTPPCVDSVIAAGVREVVACMRDPDPRVNGKGFRALRAGGVRVRVGRLRNEAHGLNERFLRYAASRLPFVTLKAGMSLDGRIATRAGESKWITSPRARAAARRLRRSHDAVMIGVNTVLEDDPGLSAAPGAGGSGPPDRRGSPPVRVILDAHLRTPPSSRILRDRARGERVLMALPGVSRWRKRRLERAGAIVLEVPGRAGRVDMRRAFAALGRRGVTSVLVEGGSEVLGSALDAGVGDRLVLFVAARLLGGRGALPVFGGRGAARLGAAARLERMTVRPVGPDFVVEGRLRFPGRRVVRG